MTRNFPVVIHKDDDSDYGATVPDLSGCFSAGRTVDEALEMVREAIQLHLEGLIEAGQAIPRLGTIEEHQTRPEYKHGVWALVPVDDSELPVKVVRLNITMPERELTVVDRYAAEHEETRSGLLVRAVSAYIGQQENETPRPARRSGSVKSWLKRNTRDKP